VRRRLRLWRVINKSNNYA